MENNMELNNEKVVALEHKKKKGVKTTVTSAILLGIATILLIMCFALNISETKPEQLLNASLPISET